MSGNRGSAYWKKRAEQGMLYAQAQADRRLDVIGTAAHQASTYLSEEARKIFRTFAGRFDLTEEEARAELAKPITRAEYDSLLARIASLPEGEARTQLEIRANSGAYGYRISRAEALRENIAVETARLAQVEYNQLTAQLNETATEGYGMRMFNIQQQTGRAFHVPNMDAARVSIDTPWFGQSYSQRIWGERDDLAEILEKEITAGYLSGKPHRKIAAEISERFEVSYDDAVRLVRTETSHISNQADLVAYRDADVHRYEYDAALDNRTCPICGKMDGKVFAVEKAVEGENFPPMHPHCRCTSLARVDGDDPKGMRRGRDAEGKGVQLPGDMDYEEWKEWQQAGAPGDVEGWRRGQKSFDLLSFGKESDIITETPKNSFKPTRYPVSQEQIDEIVANDLAGYQFPVRPVYSPRIKDNGVTRARRHPSGRTEITQILIGQQDSPKRDFLTDTILHEWWEAEIMTKQWKDSHYSKLDKMSDKDRHKWINAQIKQYFDRRDGK